jgi:hypothetical protein
VRFRLGGMTGSYPSLKTSHSPYTTQGAYRSFASALTASEPSACLRDRDRFRQCIHVHVCFMPARFARCDYGADPIRAHVRQCHRRAKGPTHSRRTCSADLSCGSPTGVGVQCIGHLALATSKGRA